MIKIYTFLLVLSLCSSYSIAQNKPDTTLYTYDLKAVAINANRMKLSSELNVQKFDNSLIESRSNEDLQSLLADYANVNIRSYGYGGLSNVSMRGANSNHTAVLWNGFNLQDPMNGGTNMLLFPLFFVDQIQVKKGGSSALFGSGAIGGVISLENNFNFNKGLQIGLFASVGSFANYQSGASLSISKKKVVFKIKTFYKEGKNDFPYTNTEQFGKPYVRQNNAALKQWGLLQENAFQIASNQIIKTHFWYQKTDHQLPPNMAQGSSNKIQLDESVRGTIDWNLYRHRWRLTFRNGTFYNKLNYSDPDTKIYSEHKSLSNISELETNIRPVRGRDLINAGINYTFEKSLSQQYSTEPQRNRGAIFASYRWNFLPRLKLTTSGRQEFAGQRFTPFTYALKLHTDYIGNFRFFTQYGTNYRIPTFNDLYWFDGMAKGNPDLKDESSWNVELGSDFVKVFKRQHISAKANFFNSRLSNLIQWVPVQGIWTPLNQQEVWSRGMEVNTNYKYLLKKWSFALGGSYSWIYSTLEKKADNEPDAILHKQLILTPEHQGNIILKGTYKAWSMEFIQSIVGRQYITADHSDHMDGYTLGNIIFSWKNQVFKQPLAISFRWNNIWNTVYQTMPSYAMPLSNFELSLRFHFNNIKS